MSPAKSTPPPPPPPPPPPAWTGYAIAPAGAPVAAKHHGHRRLLLGLVGGVAAFVLLAVVVAVVITPGPPKPCTPPYCGVAPPTAAPVGASHIYTSSQYHYSVGYFDHHGKGTRNQVVAAAGNDLKLTYPDLGDYSNVEFYAVPAHGRDAQAVVEDEVRARYASAQVAYVVPNAMVGYRPGYGAVYDVYPEGGNASSTRLRPVVMAAVKNDLAVVGVANDDYYEISGGHPTAVSNYTAYCCLDDPLNTVLWPGDPPR